MSRKATHFGHCQLCDSRQKLPAGVLAKHGYTTRWGFFSGTCRGSDHNPIEISCELIEGAQKSAKAQAASLRDEAAALRAYPVEGTTTAWVRYYHNARYRDDKSGYRWGQFEIQQASGYLFRAIEPVRPRFGQEVAPIVRSVTVPTGTPWDSDNGYKLLDVIHQLNGHRAKHLEEEAAKVDGYVRWLQERLDAWAPADLIPVAA